MNTSVNLLLLLSLRNDPAAELDAEGVPRLLREPGDRQAWQRLAALLDEAQPDGESALAESTVAAYLEGALSTTEASEVEQECWSRAESMQELASIHRAFHQPAPPAPTLSPGLQARLLSMVPEPRQRSWIESMDTPPSQLIRRRRRRPRMPRMRGLRRPKPVPCKLLRPLHRRRLHRLLMDPTNRTRLTR